MPTWVFPYSRKHPQAFQLHGSFTAHTIWKIFIRTLNDLEKFSQNFCFCFFLISIVIQLQLSAFSPHASTPPQPNPPPSSTSTLSLDFFLFSIFFTQAQFIYFDIKIFNNQLHQFLSFDKKEQAFSNYNLTWYPFGGRREMLRWGISTHLL